MFCPTCGKETAPGTQICPQCGPGAQGGAPVPQKINNYLVPAILTTVLCCLPFGIAAIVFAAQVNGKVQAGDLSGALESARKAKLFTWWAFGAGIVVAILYAVAILVPMLAQQSGG